MSGHKKTIVILGAGFGGVRCALTLEKLARKAKLSDARIILIDKNRYHTFIPALYEVASAAPQVSEDALYHRVNILIKHLLKGRDVEFIKADVASIDINEHSILFQDGNGIEYDYLAFACGAQTNFSSVEGLRDYSLDLKDFISALKIRRAVKLADEVPKTIVIGGGGTTGVELAAELATCFHNNFSNPADAPKITIIQWQERILPAFPEKISRLATRKLETLNVTLALGNYIKQITDNTIILNDGKEIPYERFFWTGGIEPHSLLANLPLQKERGFLKADSCLHPVYEDGKPEERIFALGDTSVIYDKNGKFVPWTAQKAIAEGKQAAYNIFRLITGKEKRMCLARQAQFIIPIGGKWAITKLNGVIYSGFLGWVLKNLVELRYLLSILPWYKAILKWLAAMRTFTRND